MEKRIFKLKLVWTLFCSILCCNFTFSQICELFLTFVGEKPRGYFFPLPFLKKYFSLMNQLIPLPPENNVYQDFFWLWTASERCFVFLVGYGMCPFGWGTEIWNNRAAEREGNIGSSKQKNSWTGEKCYWWKDKGNSVTVACCVLCSPWFSKYIYMVNTNGAYLMKFCKKICLINIRKRRKNNFHHNFLLTVLFSKVWLTSKIE